MSNHNTNESRKFRQSRDAGEREIVRETGKKGRLAFTDALQIACNDDPRVYGICTNAAYIEYFGNTAREEKIARGLPPKASLRDNCTLTELAGLMLLESASAERIIQSGAAGISECKSVVQSVAIEVSATIHNLQGSIP